MKKLITILILSLFAISGFSQVPDDDISPDYGTQLYISMDGQDSIALHYDGSKIYFSSTDSVKISKLILDYFTNEDEQDPVYSNDSSYIVWFSDLGYFSNADEADPLFKEWDKSRGINISTKQVTDLQSFLLTDFDSTGFEISENQISDLSHFTNSDETDPVFSAWDKDYFDLINIPNFQDSIATYQTDDQNISGSGLTGTDLTIGIESGNNEIVDLSSLDNSGTDDQILSTDNTAGDISIENGNSITLNVDDADADATNEIQSLSLATNTLSLSQDGSVDLSKYLDNTDDQTLSIDSLNRIFTINLENGGSVKFEDTYIDNDNDPTNELQNVSDSLNYFTNADEADPLFKEWDKSRGINISTKQVTDLQSFLWSDLDTTGFYTTNQDISTDGTAGNISISEGSTLNLNVDDADASPTNELQNISGSGFSANTLTIGISDGTNETVDLSSLDDPGTDDQNILGSGLSGTTLTIGIENGSNETVDLSSLDNSGTDDQTLSIDSTNRVFDISIESGNTIQFQDTYIDNDNDSSNELQDLSTDGTAGNVQISNGTNTTINVDDSDASATNELNTSVSWSDATNTVTVSDAGGDVSATITGFLESQTTMVTEHFEASSDGNNTFTLSNTADATQDCRVSFNGNTMNPANYTFTSSEISINVTTRKYDQIEISYFK